MLPNRIVGWVSHNASLQHSEWSENMICTVSVIPPKYRKSMYQLSQIISKQMTMQIGNVLPCRDLTNVSADVDEANTSVTYRCPQLL